jgi:phage terminase large subunit-like protein
MSNSRIVPADRFAIDFGIPYSRDNDPSGLPEEDLIALAEYKLWVTSPEAEEDDAEELGAAKLYALPEHVRPHALRIWQDKAAGIDPIQFGHTLPSWHEVWENYPKFPVHCILGGNRSGKTSLMARVIVFLAMNIPEARIRCYHVNDEKSIVEQQAAVWEALPNRFKNYAKKKGTDFSIQYTQKNGFTSSKLILPPIKGYKRGAEVIFGNYQQYRNDPQIVEGWWAHAIWCDEEAPLPMFERMLTRLYDAKGRMFLTFTTIKGWTPLVADLLGRTETLRTRYSGLIKRDIPVAQVSKTRPGTRIYYFWTQDNPFIPSDTVERIRGRPEREVLAVAHGIPSKPEASKFPKFDEVVHVKKHESLPCVSKLPEGSSAAEAELLAQRVSTAFTRYMVVDPSGRKPWFALWIAVDAMDNKYVYREFPDESYGLWAEPGEGPQGKPGPGQKPLGWGISEYVEEFRRAESGESIFERLMDPRLGRTPQMAMEGSTTIMDELMEQGMDFIAAPGLNIDHGLQLINNHLSYDDKQPVSINNKPKLYISDRCVNLIDALKTYVGVDREEACKDPIDCLRYALEADIQYIQLDSQVEHYSQSY